ncbi:PHO85 cyclin-5 [Collariella sp. IMI 366227]|nr:PHO85 cyclin-5 [Collariella sp. IMI 366227]
MMRDIYDPSSSLHLTNHAPYNLSLATLASSSTTSLWSDVSSQHSDDSVSTAPTSDADSCDSYYFSQPSLSSQTSVSSLGSSYEPTIKPHDPWAGHQLQTQTQVELPVELRQNPRRTSTSATSRTGRPPSLVRQSDRKVSFVDNLVDTSTHIVEAIWPTSSIPPRNESGSNAVLPLRTFIQETLRRSRTSYSTLQVALYYLILIKPHVPSHDFTSEQPDDCHSNQAIQCGRRMFLAALILASKYLQDRNYSARAWSKISGLNTLELNRNEMTFLLSVNWKLHEFRRIILALSPELDNLEELAPRSPISAHEVPVRSLYTPPMERAGSYGFDREHVSPLKPHKVPAVMEPVPAFLHAPGRFAPALGLLPTPRMTPQNSGSNTPAVSAASSVLGRSSSMGFAMAQASAAQLADRWPPSVASSPASSVTRRSSLANSVSTASSPESMVSDSSRISRSSSISSASSVNAPSSKSDAQARYRYAKQCSDRLSARPTIASVPEDHEQGYLTASPEAYSAATGKELGDMSAESFLARRQREMAEAARALAELQQYGASRPAMPVRAGSKRSRPHSLENALQEDVREMLARQHQGSVVWPEGMVRARAESQQVPIHLVSRGSYKRVCCSTEAAQPTQISSLHPAVGGYGGPGMWEGILN